MVGDVAAEDEYRKWSSWSWENYESNLGNFHPRSN